MARVVASGLVGLVLLLLVAGLARGAGDAEQADAGALPTTDLATLISTVGTALLVGAMLGLVVSAVRYRGAGGSRARALLFLLGAVVSVLLLSLLLIGLAPESEEALPRPDDAPRDEVIDGPDRLPSGPLLLVAVGALAVGGLIVAFLVRNGGDVGADDEGAGDAGEETLAPAARARLVTGLDELIEELRHDPDPRRAVIRAWSRLEDLLAEHRLARQPAEAPTSYVARVLIRLTTSGDAVEALTDAFQRAMFSPHAIERAQQLAAVDALLAVRNDLEVRV